MAEGWIKLNRKIQNNKLWNEKPFDKARAWIDLLMLANYEDKTISYKGVMTVFERGKVYLSVSYLSQRWGWSRHKTNDFLEGLKKDKMADIKRTGQKTVITIVNYDIYQTSENEKRTEKGQVLGRNSDTTKNNKNIKKFIPQNKFNDFEKTEYDFDELERLLNEN